ncbi:hypothetical protein PQX77_005943 [Marasmius sp. AFHP31]|nr:hypothetical protein PQX77_005943 [Marasmius sp. AFHP31]
MSNRGEGEPIIIPTSIAFSVTQDGSTMEDNEPKKFTVAICGGGIGGLTLACALLNHPSVSFTVFESSASFSPFKGAGIGVWPRTWSLLEELGLSEELRAVCLCPGENTSLAFSLRKSDQDTGLCFLKVAPEQGRMSSFYRPQFQEVLFRRIPAQHIRFSRRLTSYSRDSMNEKIKLNFEDGSAEFFDVLVGADGVKSVTRACLYRKLVEQAHADGLSQTIIDNYGSVIKPEFSGTVVYRAVVRPDDEPIPAHLLGREPTMYIGRNIVLVVYPVGNEGIINLSLYHFQDELRGSHYDGPWNEPVHPGEVFNITSFENWESDCREWITLFREPTTRWAIHTVKPLPTFATQNVVLLGDAAHAFPPHQGIGAGQAIEDAWILAELLGHHSTTTTTLSRALEVYDNLRRPWIDEVAERCRFNGRCYGLNYDNFPFETSSPLDAEQKLDEMGERIIDGWAWCWRTSAHSMLESALHKLETGLA